MRAIQGNYCSKIHYNILQYPPPPRWKKLSSSEYVTTQPELISSNNRTVIARELVLYTQSTMTAMSGQQWDSGDLLISRMIHIGCWTPSRPDRQDSDREIENWFFTPSQPGQPCLSNNGTVVTYWSAEWFALPAEHHGTYFWDTAFTSFCSRSSVALQLHWRTYWGVGTAQWLERRTRVWKAVGSSPSRSGRRIFLSRVNFRADSYFFICFTPVLLQ